MANINIRGVENLKMALNSIPSEVRPMVLRSIASKPAQFVVREARNIQPIGDTGRTARTIGIKRVKNQNQTFVQVGYKGRSLGNIYTSDYSITRSGRGTIKGFPFIFHNAADRVRETATKMMKVDISRVIGRGLKKYGFAPK